MDKKGASLKATIKLPIRIESEANRREHWAAKANRAKIIRSSACLMVSPHRRKILSIGPMLTIRLTRIAPRELDDDNLVRGCKAARDGVADALGMDDRDRRLRWAYAQERGEPGEYAVRIDIEPRKNNA
jgi:crossover junction endodeoxyribonuclease RusA